MNPHYIYQTIHTLSRHPLFVEEHCRILEDSFMKVYFRPLRLNAGEISRSIVDLLRSKGTPTEVSVYVELRVDIESNIEIVISEISIYNGYAMRCITPTAQVVRFDSPFGLCTSSVRREVLSFAQDIASNLGGEIALECGADGVIYSAAGATLFGVIQQTLYATRSIECVERGMVLEAAKDCGLDIVECDITKKELTTFDELFYCNHYGVTSVSRCERRSYMTIVASKIAGKMTQPWL